MASENVKDWDSPLLTYEDISEKTGDDTTSREYQNDENRNKLKNFVKLMAYRQSKPTKAKAYIESLAKPKKRTLTDNAEHFSEVMVPTERGERIKRIAAKHNTMSLKKLENVIRLAKQRQKQDFLKRKEEIFYELVSKLELQCRTQYLNLVLNKFAVFIAKLSVTIDIPPKLFDPYARMQKILLCNILQSIGVENTAQNVTYCYTNECSEYAVCQKLSHALLSLIIKALDLASTRNPNAEAVHVNPDYLEDDYMKDRLMRAAEKKILCIKSDKRK